MDRSKVDYIIKVTLVTIIRTTIDTTIGATRKMLRWIQIQSVVDRLNLSFHLSGQERYEVYASDEK